MLSVGRLGSPRTDRTRLSRPPFLAPKARSVRESYLIRRVYLYFCLSRLFIGEGLKTHSGLRGKAAARRTCAHRIPIDKWTVMARNCRRKRPGQNKCRHRFLFAFPSFFRILVYIFLIRRPLLHPQKTFPRWTVWNGCRVEKKKKEKTSIEKCKLCLLPAKTGCTTKTGKNWDLFICDIFYFVLYTSIFFFRDLSLFLSSIKKKKKKMCETVFQRTFFFFYLYTYIIFFIHTSRRRKLLEIILWIVHNCVFVRVCVYKYLFYCFVRKPTRSDVTINTQCFITCVFRTKHEQIGICCRQPAALWTAEDIHGEQHVLSSTETTANIIIMRANIMPTPWKTEFLRINLTKLFVTIMHSLVQY